jgi:hypothetical protein
MIHREPVEDRIWVSEDVVGRNRDVGDVGAVQLQRIRPGVLEVRTRVRTHREVHDLRIGLRILDVAFEAQLVGRVPVEVQRQVVVGGLALVVAGRTRVAAIVDRAARQLVSLVREAGATEPATRQVPGGGLILFEGRVGIEVLQMGIHGLLG